MTLSAASPHTIRDELTAMVVRDLLGPAGGDGRRTGSARRPRLSALPRRYAGTQGFRTARPADGRTRHRRR